MRVSKSSFILLVVAMVVTGPVSLRAGENETTGSQRRWKADDLVSGTDALRSQAVADHVTERNEVVRALIAVGSNDKLSDALRSRAILQLGRFRTAAAIDFCVRSISLRTDRQSVRMDKSQRAYAPCRAALLDAGWAVVPACLAQLARTEADERDLKELSFVLRSVCGREAATRLVSAIGHKDPPVSKALRTQLERVRTYVQEYDPELIVPRPPR